MAVSRVEDQLETRKHAIIQNINLDGAELDEDELRIVAGGRSQPDGSVSYAGGPAGCWGDYDPPVPR